MSVFDFPSNDAMSQSTSSFESSRILAQVSPTIGSTLTPELFFTPPERGSVCNVGIARGLCAAGGRRSWEKTTSPGNSRRSGDFSELTPTCGLCRALRPLSSYNVYVTTRITGLVRSHEAAGPAGVRRKPHTRPTIFQEATYYLPLTFN